MATDPASTTSALIRTLLTANPKLTADEVIKEVHARGVQATAESIRNLTYNVRSGLKKRAAKDARATKAAPPRAAKPPKPSTTKSKPAPAAARETAPKAVDLSPVFATLATVDAAVEACGGLEVARQVADAVAACGGPDGFTQHLDLLAVMRGMAKA